jgi:phenylacetate-CoA ligase
LLARVLLDLLSLSRNYRISPAELRKLQDRKVRAIVKYSYEHVRFYHSSFRKMGIMPDDVRGVDDLYRLPKLTRAEITANYPEGIAAKGAGVGITHRTSGTTGKSLSIQWGRGFCDIHAALQIRRSSVQRVNPRDRVALVYTGSGIPQERDSSEESAGGWIVWRVLFGSFNLRYLAVSRRNYFLGKANIRATARSLMDFKPDVLYTRPSYARRLGRMMQDEGTPLNVGKVMCNGEFVSEGTKRDLREILGAEVYVHYGAAEMGSMAFECPEHTGMHTNADTIICEVNKEGGPASPGEAGSVVLTNLHNEAMPLVRYEIGDVAVPEEEERCACGSYFPKLRAVYGRRSEGLVTSRGDRIPQGTVCEFLESTMGLRDYQVIQKGIDRIVVRVREGQSQQELGDRLRSYLSRELESDVSVELETWRDDDMPAKYRPVMSEIQSSEG